MYSVCTLWSPPDIIPDPLQMQIDRFLPPGPRTYKKKVQRQMNSKTQQSQTETNITKLPLLLG